MSATSRHRIAGASLHDLNIAERDARKTADDLVIEIAGLHNDGRGNDPLCAKLMADLAIVHTRLKRLEGLASAAENDLDGGQWL